MNGIASVVASAGAVTVAIVAGFPAATFVALGCYLVALAHVRLGAWAQPQRVEHPPASRPHARPPVLEPADG